MTTIPETPQRLDRRTQPSFANTVRGVGKGLHTLIRAPDHDHALFNEVKESLTTPQPTHPPIEKEIAAIIDGPAKLIDHEARSRMSTRQLLGTMGVCLQFTCHVPELRPYAYTPFENVDKLYEEIVAKGSKKPLDFADQLTTALRQTEGDLPEATWRLFIASRQHARWLDESVIIGAPAFTRDQKKERMYNFSSSVAACKPYENTPNQDASGDTYYAWTHALGGLVFGALAEKDQAWGTQLGDSIMHKGTQLMSEIAFRITPQNMPSDHRLASEYGNAIGDTLVSILNPAEQL